MFKKLMLFFYYLISHPDQENLKTLRSVFESRNSGLIVSVLIADQFMLKKIFFLKILSKIHETTHYIHLLLHGFRFAQS